MFEKSTVLIIILLILITFYVVISLGAGIRKNSSQSPEIKRYLFGVRVLIIIIVKFFFYI